jgi:hypothetical protein
MDLCIAKEQYILKINFQNIYVAIGYINIPLYYRL